MDSFKLLKRRTMELFDSIEDKLPHSLPSFGGGSHGMKGTWEKIQVPPLPRSSHSADIVDGTLYIFGGEVEPRRPVDNDMHAITLPASGAQADYYAIKAKPAKPAAQTKEKPAIPPVGGGEPTPDSTEAGEDDDDDDEDEDEEKPLAEVSLTTPSPGPGKSQGGEGSLTAAPHPELPDVPPPRVGHATAVIGHRIFLFGGRGGPDMTPLDEGGRVWVFDTQTRLWSYLDPRPAAAGLSSGEPPHPAPRSYHCAVATPKPDSFTNPTAHPSSSSSHHQHQGQPHKRQPSNAEAWRDWALGTTPETGTPQRPIVGVVAERAVDADADGFGTFIIHGGCVAGEPSRMNDVWAFDVRSRVWQRLPDAPGSARGGAALALSRSRLYRFGGFNGTSQEGGQLDFLELGVDSFDDQVSKGEAVLCARKGGWKSLLFPGREDVGYKEADPATKPLEDDVQWPGNRSVASLEAVTVGGGREYLVLMFGEREASGKGHAAAGRFWDDVWAFQVPAQGMSLASVTDTAFSVVGKSGEGRWMKVETGPHDDEDDASADGPGARGWVASAPMGELEENGIVVWGGLNEANQRLGDGWIFRLG